MSRTNILLEERLRESSALGDIKVVHELLVLGVDVNARHAINGWTALHWACKRNFFDIVLLLLQNGADKNVLSNNEETPASVCTNSRILHLLKVSDAYQMYQPKEETIKFIPNYIKNPPLNLNSKTQNYGSEESKSESSCNNKDNVEKDLILKVRIANSNDPDFIEIEIPNKSLTYDTLVNKCCEELNINNTDIIKLRKLPNTKLRNNKDIHRLIDFQEIEVVTYMSNVNANIKNGTAVMMTASNSYQSISKKDQTILY